MKCAECAKSDATHQCDICQEYFCKDCADVRIVRNTVTLYARTVFRAFASCHHERRKRENEMNAKAPVPSELLDPTVEIITDSTDWEALLRSFENPSAASEQPYALCTQQSATPKKFPFAVCYRAIPVAGSHVVVFTYFTPHQAQLLMAADGAEDENREVRQTHKFKNKSGVIRVLGSLLATDGSVRYGVTVQQLKEQTGLADHVMAVLAELLQQGLVEYFISQEGTAGPYLHRYRLAKDVMITVTSPDVLDETAF